jgi:hypothetical protein
MLAAEKSKMTARAARYLLAFAMWPACCSSQSAPATAPEANPSRPTVSTPATLTPVGYLQFENGFLFAKDSLDFSSRFALNQVTKLTVHPRIELILQSEPLVHFVSSGQPDLREGEVFAGVQAVLVPGHESRPTVSVSYIRRLHQSVAPEIDIGTFRQSVLILVSGEVWGFHFDANGIASEQREESVRRAQFGQTLSVSHPLKGFTIAGEIWHFSQPMHRGNAAGNLWAVSYPLRKNLVVDGGFNRGLTSTSTKWELFAGFTYLLPHRLWRAKK